MTLKAKNDSSYVKEVARGEEVDEGEQEVEEN